MSSQILKPGQYGEINGIIFNNIISDNCIIDSATKIKRYTLEKLAWKISGAKLVEIDKRKAGLEEYSEKFFAHDYLKRT